MISHSLGTRVVALSICALALSVNVGAQRLPAFSSIPEKLDPGFAGNEPRAVIDNLLRRRGELGLVKDEYISTAEFEKRKREGMKKLAAEGYFIFTSKATAGYDADKQVLTASHLLLDIWKPGTITVEAYSIPLLTDYKDLGQYEASNAYGAKAIVKKRVETEYSIHFPRSQPGAMKALLKRRADLDVVHLAATMKMTPDEARIARPNLMWAFAIRVAAPPGETKRHTDPKINYPYDEDKIARFVPVEVVRVMLFNSGTGAVLYQAK